MLSQLDDDVLGTIVQTALDTALESWPSKAHLFTATALSRVNQRLRAILLGRGSYWNHILARSANASARVTAMAKRAKEVPLVIHLGYLTVDEPLASLMRSLRPKISKLELVVLQGDLARMATSQDAPLLDELRIGGCLPTTLDLVGSHTTSLFLSNMRISDRSLERALETADAIQELSLTNVDLYAEPAPQPPQMSGIARRLPLRRLAAFGVSRIRLLNDVLVRHCGPLRANTIELGPRLGPQNSRDLLQFLDLPRTPNPTVAITFSHGVILKFDTDVTRVFSIDPSVLWTRAPLVTAIQPVISQVTSLSISCGSVHVAFEILCASGGEFLRLRQLIIMFGLDSLLPGHSVLTLAGEDHQVSLRFHSLEVFTLSPSPSTERFGVNAWARACCDLLAVLDPNEDHLNILQIGRDGDDAELITQIRHAVFQQFASKNGRPLSLGSRP